jgi:hypothetical protein
MGWDGGTGLKGRGERPEGQGTLNKSRLFGSINLEAVDIREHSCNSWQFLLTFKGILTWQGKRMG